MQNNEGNVTNIEEQNTGIEPTNTQVEDNEKGQDTPVEKTFTQDEVNKMIEKRLARAIAKMESDRKEAEELAKLSEAERQAKLF